MPSPAVEADLLLPRKVSLLNSSVTGGVVVYPPVVSLLVVLPNMLHLGQLQVIINYYLLSSTSNNSCWVSG